MNQEQYILENSVQCEVKDENNNLIGKYCSLKQIASKLQTNPKTLSRKIITKPIFSKTLNKKILIIPIQ